MNGESAPGPQREVQPNLLAAAGLVVALVLTLLFAFSYVGALHDPHPQRMPIAVLGPRAAAAVTPSNGMFVPRVYGSLREIRSALRRRDVLAALVPPRLLIASAGGYAATQYTAAAFASAQPNLRVVDVAPLPAGDSRGLTLFYLTVALIFGGYFAATVVTTLVGPRSRSHRGAALRVGALLAFSLLAGFLTTVVVARPCSAGGRDWILGCVRRGDGDLRATNAPWNCGNPDRTDLVRPARKSLCRPVPRQLRSGFLAGDRALASWRRRSLRSTWIRLLRRHRDRRATRPARRLRHRRRSDNDRAWVATRFASA